jgi:hypothetical protein
MHSALATQNHDLGILSEVADRVGKKKHWQHHIHPTNPRVFLPSHAANLPCESTRNVVMMTADPGKFHADIIQPSSERGHRDVDEHTLPDRRGRDLWTVDDK